MGDRYCQSHSYNKSRIFTFSVHTINKFHLLRTEKLSMAPKNDEVSSSSSSYIPDDVSFIILSKLRLKSVKRFTCTCKSWSLLFENPIFMNMFCKRFIFMHQSLYNDTSLFLDINDIDQGDSNLYLLSGEELKNKVVKLEWPFPFRHNGFIYYHYHILDSGINDIICFYDFEHANVKLWNPATKELVSVPSSPAQDLPAHRVCFNLHGYGYDHVNDDYKIIRYVHVTYKSRDYVDRIYLPKSPHPFWEIFSVRSNSWKRLDLVDMPISRGRKVYLNGLCHWWADRDDTYMVSFNLSNEVFFTTHLPLDMEDSYPGKWVKRGSNGYEWVNRCFDLVVLNGFVALISKHLKTASFHIYVLGELGVRESWTKLFILGSLPSVERLIGVGKKGDIFFIKNDKELASLDLNTQKIEDLGVKGLPNWYEFAIYKKNILPIGPKKD